MEPTQWIWQHPTWPQFRYDVPRIAAAVQRARLAQARLLSRAEIIGFAELQNAHRRIWEADAIATAAIEGEQLNLDAVRSSVARRLGVAAAPVQASPRPIEGLLDTMENAITHWDSALTVERLWLWQADIFRNDNYAALKGIATGRYRRHNVPMQIVSGPEGRQTIHYEASPTAAVPAEMRLFIDWFNRTRTDPQAGIDGIVRAGLAHLWFEIIHPFEDGNGRVGRAIIDLALAQDAKAPHRLHGVSRQCYLQHLQYHEALNVASRSDGEVTAWLLWFIDVFTASCETAVLLIDESMERMRFWATHHTVALNARQRKALNKMLEAGAAQFEGGMTARKYVSLTRASPITATRDLAELTANGLLVREGEGRATFYNLAMAGWGWVPVHKTTIKQVDAPQ